MYAIRSYYENLCRTLHQFILIQSVITSYSIHYTKLYDAGQDFVGIVQNKDDLVTTIYDYGAIVETELKEKFLELGDVWWWESNRQIPIHLFLKQEWILFKPFLRTFNNKSLVFVHGPVVSMRNNFV